MMLAMHKEMSIELVDLKTLCVRCTNCKAELVLDLRTFQGLRLNCCTACGNDFNPQLARDISALLDMHRNAGKINYELFFRVAEPIQGANRVI